MRRDHDALLALIDEREKIPFAWRQPYDCVSFAARAVKVQTGHSPLGALRWGSLKGAQRVIEAVGGMEAAVDARLNRIPPAMAQRGDIAGVSDDRFGVRLMVVEGSTLVAPGPKGLRRMPRAAMIAAWSIDDIGDGGDV